MKAARISGKNLVVQHKFYHKEKNLILEIFEYYKNGWIDIEIGKVKNLGNKISKIAFIESKIVIDGYDIEEWSAKGMTSQEIKLYNYFYSDDMTKEGLALNKEQLDVLNKELREGTWDNQKYRNIWEIGIIEEENGWKKQEWYVHFLAGKPIQELH